MISGVGPAGSAPYGALPSGANPVITDHYERVAEQAVELQLKRAAVRLAWVLNNALR